jgi:hypothetical protein
VATSSIDNSMSLVVLHFTFLHPFIELQVLDLMHI